MTDVAAGGQAGSGERRVVTALFCDIVGSTTLAESMDPEEWSEVVNETVNVIARSVERYGGTVSQFAGDSILALFGAPRAHEDDPYRAIRSGLDIIDSVRVLSGRGVELHVRVGVHTGLVIAGEIGAGELEVYSALGDTANVSARIQSLAEPDTVFVSEDTHRLVANDIEVRVVGPTELKGRAEPVGVYEVTAIKGLDERTRGVAGLTSPMVGRDAELAELTELLETAAAGMGRVAAILGEPGVGKTRLTEETGERVRRRGGGLWAVGRCVPYDDELPYHLLASLVRSLAGVTSSDAPDVIAKAVTGLAESAGTPEATGPLLRLVGVETGHADDKAEVLTAAYGEALLSVVGALGAQHRPVVLVCEDAHWADPSSIELMSRLLEHAPSIPMLLLLVMRPDRDSGGWRILAEARRRLAESLTEIVLTALDEDSSRAIVANLLEIESLPGPLRQMVLDKAEGNPFFLEEVVRTLIDRDMVEHRDGRWVGRPGIDDLEVPATLHGLLASRIDLLPPAVRRAGRIAAVIGRQFPAPLFEAVNPSAGGPAGATTLHPHVGELGAHGIIRLAGTRPELEFAFRHALIHDVLYEGLLKRERRQLHGQVADAIEGLYPTRVRELAPALARHCAEAGDNDRAIAHLMTAGETALSRGARPESHSFYSQAIDLLQASEDADPSLVIDAAIGRAQAGMGFTPGPEAIAQLESVFPSAERLGDADKLAALYVQLMWVRNMQGESFGSDSYREQLGAAYELVPRLTDPGVRASIQGMMGLSMRAADEYEASIPLLDEAVDGLEAADRLSEASYHASMLADSHATLGRFADAESVIARAAELGEASGDPNAILDADIIRGRIASERGDLQAALEHTRRGVEAADAVGNTFCSLAGNFLVADQKLRLGNAEEAITHLERSTSLAQYCNAGGYEALGQAWLAAARARLGNLEPEGFAEPLKKAMSAGSRSGEALVRLNRAIAIAGTGRPEGSFDDFERALELFSSFGAEPNLARAHHAYGQALEAAGISEEASSHLRQAERIFSDLGFRPDPVINP